MKVLTFNRYRTINIMMLAAIFTALEVMVTLGANRWFTEANYTLSFAIIYAALEMMRWEFFGGIAIEVSALAFCIAAGANQQEYGIYCIGSLAMILAVFFLKTVGAEKVRKNILLTIVYVILVYALAQLGRWGMSCALGNDPALIWQFFTTDSLSGVFGIVVILILRKADGMFEEQRSYLKRLDEERIRKEDKEKNIYEAKLYRNEETDETNETGNPDEDRALNEAINQADSEEPEEGGEWL